MHTIMAKLYDIHSILVLATTVYFALIAVLNGALAVNGVIPFQTYVSAHTLVFINIFFGIAYLLYVTMWKGNIILRYEDSIFRKLIFFAVLGVAFHVALYFLQHSLLSTSQLAITTYYLLLGMAYAFVAFTENAFFIGVIGDFVAEHFSYSRKGNIIAAIISALVAGAVAAVFHFGPYGSSLRALAVVAFWFGFWTFASLETRSTLYADFHHAVGNYIGFIWSAVQVIA